MTYCYGAKAPPAGCASATAPAIGQLISVTSANAQTLYTAYDALGRVLGQSQMSGGNTYNFKYGYLLSGAVSSETYPSGRVFSTSYNQLNEPYSLSGLLNGTTTTYATGTDYFPNGALNGRTFGNGIYRNTNLNSRLQQISHSDSLNSNNQQYMWMENLTWQDANQHDNGNLQSLQIYAGGTPSPQGNLLSYSETFGYDNVNRLASASESTVPASQTSFWSQIYGYDAYGNMWIPSTTWSAGPADGAGGADGECV